MRSRRLPEKDALRALLPAAERHPAITVRDFRLARLWATDGLTATAAGRHFGISGARVGVIVDRVYRRASESRAYGDGEVFPTLSMRSRICLRNEGIDGDEALLRYAAEHGITSLLRTPNFGRRSLGELIDAYQLPYHRIDILLTSDTHDVLKVLARARSVTIDGVVKDLLDEIAKAYRTRRWEQIKAIRDDTSPQKRGKISKAVLLRHLWPTIIDEFFAEPLATAEPEAKEP